jgi:DNA-binding CsgD family transcriptional regulator
MPADRALPPRVIRMLTPQATVAKASARDDVHALRPLLARGFGRARAGLVSESLEDLARVRPHIGHLTDLERVALLTTEVDCRLARGELELALSLGDELGRFLEAPGVVGGTAHYARGEVAAAAADAELAAGHFARAGRLVAGVDDDPNVLPWRTAAALAAVRVGRRAEAATLAREHLTLARSANAPYAVALGLRALATVDPHGDPISLLREAGATLTGVAAARLVAQLDTDLAGLLLLSGRSDVTAEALSLLRRSEEYAGRQDLWPLQSRIRRLLDRLGEPARPVHREALAALTASERRVARLAADGMTNREIAQQLVVTVKAIEWHLSRVYRKLGIRSRAGLASTLGLSART